MVDVGEWLDIRGAAERQGLSDTAIRNHIKKGNLRSVKRLVTGRDGRMVVKRLIRVSDLDVAFPPFDLEAYIREIDESAPPMTREQVMRIDALLQTHIDKTHGSGKK